LHDRQRFTSHASFFFSRYLQIKVRKRWSIQKLFYRVKEGDLQQVMEDYGAVSSVKVVMDRETGKSKGFAFIEMEDDAAAAKAIAELNGAEYMGRTMVVKEARPRA